MIHANETPRHPHADEYADIEAAWGDEPREPFAGDALAVAATEYVAAEVRVEPFWKALIGAIGVFVTALGLCAWAALADGPPPGFFPENLPNMATRYETYCLMGKWPCIERRVKEWGQACHTPRVGGSPYLDGVVPWGFWYDSWRCDLLSNPRGNVATSGK